MTLVALCRLNRLYCAFKVLRQLKETLIGCVGCHVNSYLDDSFCNFEKKNNTN